MVKLAQASLVPKCREQPDCTLISAVTVQKLSNLSVNLMVCKMESYRFLGNQAHSNGLQKVYKFMSELQLTKSILIIILSLGMSMSVDQSLSGFYPVPDFLVV